MSVQNNGRSVMFPRWIDTEHFSKMCCIPRSIFQNLRRFSNDVIIRRFLTSRRGLKIMANSLPTKPNRIWFLIQNWIKMDVIIFWHFLNSDLSFLFSFSFRWPPVKRHKTNQISQLRASGRPPADFFDAQWSILFPESFCAVVRPRVSCPTRITLVPDLCWRLFNVWNAKLSV